jgi:hypothetical protein
MDSVTQQNAALVEEASAASKAMEHQAQVLIEQIAYFSGMNSVAAPAAAPSSSGARKAQVQSLPARKRRPVPPAAPVLARAGNDNAWQEF